MSEVEQKQPVILGFGPDTAYYTIRPTDPACQPVKRELDAELQEELQMLKSQAQEQDEYVPTRWSFEGQNLFMRDKGGSQFKWIMENDFITLSIGRGKKTGVIGQVRLSSEYLWANCGSDLGVALSKVHLFLSLVYGPYIALDQSSLDLCADVLHFDLSAMNIKEQFISRAILDTERPAFIDDGYIDGPTSIQRRWKKVAGLTFGMHTSATSAVIYNKTDEIKYHSAGKKAWFIDIWAKKAKELGIEYTEDMPVHRVEIRFTRTAFRELPDVSGAYDVLSHLHDLWTYGVGHIDGGDDGLPDGWLRYVVPNADTNRSRWPVHPSWQVVQQAFVEPALPLSPLELNELKQTALSLDDSPFKHEVVKSSSLSPAPETEVRKKFVRTRKRVANVQQGIAQIAGWISTLEAWRRGYAVDQGDDERELDAVLLRNYWFASLDQQAGVRLMHQREREIGELDISGTLRFIEKEVQLYLKRKKLDFSEVVTKKRVTYRLQEASSKVA